MKASLYGIGKNEIPARCNWFQEKTVENLAVKPKHLFVETFPWIFIEIIAGSGRAHWRRFHSGQCIAFEILGRAPGIGRSSPTDSSGGVIAIPAAGRSLRSVEAELVRVTLQITHGNKSAAARVLGVSRPTLHRKIEEYGIVTPPEPH